MTEQELAGMIWNIKEIIRGVYDDTEVENVILPFTLLRRLDCVLQDRYDELYQQYRAFPEEKKEVMLMALMRRNGLTFFNTSGLSLNKLLAQPKMLADNFKAYLDGFTPNVRNILLAFTQEDGENGDITRIYSRLDRNDLLFQVTESFVNNADLHPDKVDNAMMGTIFEIIIRKSKETTNTKAGQFYTPRGGASVSVARDAWARGRGEYDREAFPDLRPLLRHRRNAHRRETISPADDRSQGYESVSFRAGTQ